MDLVLKLSNKPNKVGYFQLNPIQADLLIIGANFGIFTPMFWSLSFNIYVRHPHT